MKVTREMGIDSEFVIVSAYGEFSYTQNAINYGIFHYMLKPIELDDADKLLQKRKSHLDYKKVLNEKVSDLDVLDELMFGRFHGDYHCRQRDRHGSPRGGST